MVYYVNGKRYVIKWERCHYIVTEFAKMFDGLFESETGEVVHLDNFAEVREYLTKKNGGVEVW